MISSFFIFISFLVSIVFSSFFSTNLLWNNFKRPSWAGNITIFFNNSFIYHVSGVVIPMNTSDRPSPSSPSNCYSTGKPFCLDKGHIMGLSIGGPESPFNVVPQLSYWQRYGFWRQQFEIPIHNFAISIYNFNGKTIPAKLAYYLPKPPNCLVHFNIFIASYDYITGEPLLYRGYINCNNLYFYFIIKSYGPPHWYPFSPLSYFK